MTNFEKALRDAIIFGAGYIIDGEHVKPENVVVIEKPRADDVDDNN